MKDRKIVIIILLMLTITFTIMGTTFAYFTWQTSESQKTEVIFSIDKKMSCSADIGGTISSNDTSLMPDSCTGSHAIKRTLTTRTQTTDNTSLYMDLWLDIKSISSGLSNSNNFKYSLTTSNNSCSTNVVTYGTFNGLNTGDKVELLSSIESTASKTDTYYLYIWLDETETSTDTQNQTFSLSLNGECSDILLTTATTLIKNANREDLLYTNATSEQRTNLWTFSHSKTDQTEALTDYRYIGTSPSNYIEFNKETWRIIGVFNERIKIIKDTELNSLPYDKKSGVGSATTIKGSNDWTDSQLMYMLNPTPYSLKNGYIYEDGLVKDDNGDVIYKTGCEPQTIEAGKAYSCIASTWSLNTTSLSQIDKTIYYLGGSTSLANTNAEAYYMLERSGTANWTGYVALPYASDYAYTFANGVNYKCYNDTPNCTVSSNGKPEASWMRMNKSGLAFWLLSDNSNYYYAFLVYTSYQSGNIDSHGVTNTLSATPVVYLKKSIKLTGSGTITDMYKIS